MDKDTLVQIKKTLLKAHHYRIVCRNGRLHEIVLEQPHPYAPSGMQIRYPVPVEIRRGYCDAVREEVRNDGYTTASYVTSEDNRFSPSSGEWVSHNTDALRLALRGLPRGATDIHFRVHLDYHTNVQCARARLHADTLLLCWCEKGGRHAIELAQSIVRHSSARYGVSW